jgi:hypothetical protein
VTRYTDTILTIIAILLAIIAWQQHAQRPVTISEFEAARDSTDLDAGDKLTLRVPVVRASP